MMIATGYLQPVKKQIVVTGKAINAMGGAVVVCADQASYYLDGMDHWDSKYYGKKIKVSGILVVITKTKKKPVEQVILVQHIIKQPKWQLVN